MAPASNEILIKNVSRSAGESHVRNLLFRFQPTYVKLLPKESGVTQAAVAQFSSSEAASVAVAELNGYEWMDGLSLNVGYNSQFDQLRGITEEPRRGGNTIPPPDHAHSLWNGGPLNTMGPRPTAQPRSAPTMQQSGTWQDEEDPPLPPPPNRGVLKPTRETIDPEEFFGSAPRGGVPVGRVAFYSSEPAPVQQPPPRKVTFDNDYLPPPRSQQPFPTTNRYEAPEQPMVAPSYPLQQPPQIGLEGIPFERMPPAQLVDIAYRLTEENNRLKSLIVRYEAERKERSAQPGPQAQPTQIPQPWRQPPQQQGGANSYGYDSTVGGTGPNYQDAQPAVGNRFQFDFDQASSNRGAPMRRSLEGNTGGYEETPTTSGMWGGRGAGGTIGMRGGRGGGRIGGGYVDLDDPANSSVARSRFGNPAVDDIRNEKSPNESSGPSSKYDRPPRRESGGFDDASRDQPRERGGFGRDQSRERGVLGERKEGGFGERREGGFGERREGGFGERREGGFGERREGGFGERREGGFGERREGGFSERREGGSGNTNCYKCNKPGHFSRECPEAGDNAGAREGRMTRDGGNGGCYKCGGSGHFARECPQAGENAGGGSRGNCYKCNQPGHMSRDCPQGGGGARLSGGGGRDMGRPRRDNAVTAPSASTNKGMVDDEFAEPDESETPKPSVESALERPTQRKTSVMVEEEEQEKKNPEPSAVVPVIQVTAPSPAEPKNEPIQQPVFVPSPITTATEPPAPVFVPSPTTPTAEPPALAPVVPAAPPASTPPAPASTTSAAPKARFNLPMFPKLGVKPAAPAPAPAPAPAEVKTQTPGSCCSNCSKTLPAVTKYYCPTCAAPMCGDLKCLDSHVDSETCVKLAAAQKLSTGVLSPENLRRQEAEKQPDAWKESLDQIEATRFEKLAKNKPTLVTVLNFKSPDDFFVFEKSMLDETIWRMHLPVLANQAEVIPESSREMKPGLLAYSTVPLKALPKQAKHLLASPFQRTIDSMVARGDDNKEFIFDPADYVRCVVLAVNYSTMMAHVFSLDGAFEAEVSTGALRYANEAFKSQPIRAIRCTMSPSLASANGQWPSYENFALLQSKEYYAVFGDVIDGKISCQLADSRDYSFVADKLAASKIGSLKSAKDVAKLECPADSSHSFYSPYDWLYQNQELNARFASVRNLDDFSLMLYGSTDPTTLATQLCRFYDNMPSEQSLKKVEKGQLVVVGRKGSWDRGVCRGNGTIDLVDSGHHLTLNSCVDISIFPLCYQFLVQPAIGAAKCRLQEGIVNSIDHFEPQTIKTFITFFSTKDQVKLRLVAKEKTTENELRLVVTFAEANLREQLIAAINRPVVTTASIENYISIDQTYTAMVLETEPKNGNIVQAKIRLMGPEYDQALEALQTLSVDKATARKVPRPAVYQVCLRIVSDAENGDEISRVKVLGPGETPETVRVELMDTAEIEDVPISELVEATKEIAELRRLALRCRIELSNHYPEVIEQYQTFDFKAGWTAQDGWVFTIKRLMIDQGIIPQAQFEGRNGAGIVYNVESPDSFFIVITVYEDLEAAVQEYADAEPPRYVDGTALIVGELCVAKFDAAWYRAVIVEAGVKPQIFFVDYGNTAVIENPTDDLRPFSERLGSRWPVQGIVCQLAGVTPISQGGEWPPEAVEQMKSLILDQPVDFTIVKEEEGNLEVQLLLTESQADVATELISAGFARA